MICFWCAIGMAVGCDEIETAIGLTGFQIKNPTCVGLSIQETTLIFYFENITPYIRWLKV